MAVGRELRAGAGCSACPAWGGGGSGARQGAAGWVRRERGGRYCESSSQWLTVGLESRY